MVEHGKYEEMLVVANGESVMRIHGPRCGHEIMNKKKTIELLVLPPPKAVRAENGHEDTDESEQGVSCTQTDSWWSAGELGE